jgi:hypothetical protein
VEGGGVTKDTIVAVMVRLFAVAIAFHVATHIPAMAHHLSELVDLDYSTFVVLLLGSVLIALALALWLFPLRIANAVIPRADAPSERYPWAPIDVLTIGFILIGVYVAYDTFTAAFYWGYLLVARQYGEVPWDYLSPQNKASMVLVVVQMIIAIALIFGARGFARFLVYLRWAGRTSPN